VISNITLHRFENNLSPTLIFTFPFSDLVRPEENLSARFALLNATKSPTCWPSTETTRSDLPSSISNAIADAGAISITLLAGADAIARYQKAISINPVD
jgi:hypothetical protein